MAEMVTELFKENMPFIAVLSQGKTRRTSQQRAMRLNPQKLCVVHS